MAPHHARYGRKILARKRTEDDEVDGMQGEVDDEVEEEAPKFTTVSTVIYSGMPINLSASPKTIYKRAVAMGFTMQMVGTLTHHPATVYAAASLKTGKQKGDVKDAEKRIKHIYMAGMREDAKVGFFATWNDGKFGGARIADPLGIYRELYFGYGDTERGLRQHQDYNDDEQILLTRAYLPNATKFTEWILDWLQMLAPEAMPKPKAPKKVKPTADESLIAPLSTGEWIG